MVGPEGDGRVLRASGDPGRAADFEYRCSTRVQMDNRTLVVQVDQDDTDMYFRGYYPGKQINCKSREKVGTPMFFNGSGINMMGPGKLYNGRVGMSKLFSSTKNGDGEYMVDFWAFNKETGSESNFDEVVTLKWEVDNTKPDLRIECLSAQNEETISQCGSVSISEASCCFVFPPPPPS